MIITDSMFLTLTDEQFLDAYESDGNWYISTLGSGSSFTSAVGSSILPSIA